MSIIKFLTSLELGEELYVTKEPEAFVPEKLTAIIQRFDQNTRSHAPENVPELNIEAATAAATLFYDCTRFSIFQNIEPEAIEEIFLPPFDFEDVSIHYSVDLFFRHLAIIYKKCRMSAPGEPLTDKIAALLYPWPLSNVVIKGFDTANDSIIVKHTCLKRIYLDRIIKYINDSRLTDPELLEAFKQAVGLNEELAPQLTPKRDLIHE
jgi:hypothetical protein